MSTPTFADVILETVNLARGNSFVDLENAFAWAGLDYAGELELVKTGNIVLWAGWNEAATAALFDLESTGRVHFYPTSAFTYLADGKIVNYPIAKRPRHHYKTPRWAPACIEAGPYPERSRR